ncbi:Uncharacterized protein Adt_11254 [Abeliophyllum distichum]|uniref:Uncharacterized protein n=1 Tax=Abeliophyllum distichum TaxID=126358 RepID=A0ABD1UMC1_9LAMI
MEYQEIDEDNMLVGDFLTPQNIQSQYEIDEDNMLVGYFIAMHQANTTRYYATFEINEEVDTIMVLSAKIDSLAHKIESMSHSVYVMQTKKSTSEIDEDNMLFGDFIAMQQINIARYDATSEIDEDNMLVGDFIADHPNFSWKNNYNNNRPHGHQFQQLEKKTLLEDIRSSVPDTLPSNTEVNPKENVAAITTRSEVQLPKIHVKMPVANKEKVPSTDEEHVEQTEQTTYIKESSGIPQVKATVPIKPYEPPVPLSQRL